jgi:predicted lactoylglutathione lyase
MTRMIFVNLPVADLARSMAFYGAIGFTNEPRFTDETAAAMQWSDTIVVMLLTHDKWRSFTQRPIPDSGSSEVMLCVSCADRAEVNGMTDAAGARGGAAEINPAQDHGFMMSRSFADPDGHVWEAMWMDPAVANSNAHISEASA